MRRSNRHGNQFLKPAIWRRVLVPDAIKQGGLHQETQTAMGWEDTGDVDYRRFKIEDPPKIPLAGPEPF